LLVTDIDTVTTYRWWANGIGFYLVEMQVATNGNVTKVTYSLEPPLPNPPTALFGYVPGANRLVTFSDQSLDNPTSWFWDFGDGNTATTQNATNTFAKDSTYVVCLIATNAYGTDTICDSITVCGANAGFMVPNTSCIGDTIDFVGTSTGATGFMWKFDNFVFDTNSSTAGTIDTAGTFTITLVVDNGTCSDSVSQPITVFNGPLALWQVLDKCIGDTSQFVDVSIAGDAGLSGWEWKFGNGDSSSMQFPKYAYLGTGTYNATLTVTDSNGCTDVLSKTTTVNALPTADFGYSYPGSFLVNFSDSSSNAVSWSWDFGDASTPATTQNPSHTFAGTGSFNVCLSIVDTNGCAATFCDTVHLLTGLGLNQIADKQSMFVYPNPVTTHLYIERVGTDNEELFCNIYGINGKLHGHASIPGGQSDLTLDMQPFEGGIYHLLIRNASGYLYYSGTFIVSKK